MQWLFIIGINQRSPKEYENWHLRGNFQLANKNIELKSIPHPIQLVMQVERCSGWATRLKSRSLINIQTI